MVNRKLFRPTLTEVKEPPRRVRTRRAAAAQKARAAGADPCGEFLLGEADAGAHAHDHRPDRWRSAATARWNGTTATASS